MMSASIFSPRAAHLGKGFGLSNRLQSARSVFIPSGRYDVSSTAAPREERGVRLCVALGEGVMMAAKWLLSHWGGDKEAEDSSGAATIHIIGIFLVFVVCARECFSLVGVKSVKQRVR